MVQKKKKMEKKVWSNGPFRVRLFRKIYRISAITFVFDPAGPKTLAKFLIPSISASFLRGRSRQSNNIILFSICMVVQLELQLEI